MIEQRNRVRAKSGNRTGEGLRQLSVVGDDAAEHDQSATEERSVSRAIVLAFAPLHKAAFGAAVALVGGMAFALATLGDMLLDPQHRAGLDLVSEYFYGYTVSPTGVVIGFLWAAVVGFVGGWFLAFARNAVMALWVLYFRARADWLATGDFLDHI